MDRRTLRITVAGGGPVGLMFALSIKSLMPREVAIEIFDDRWRRDGTTIAWRGKDEGNARRQQVVTIQSRQFSRFPEAVQEALFADRTQYSEMWPIGSDSPRELGPPRNMRISYIEDKLLDLAEREGHIELRTERFDPKHLTNERVLVISDGAGSSTREHYINKFGNPDLSVYSIDGSNPLQDTVLGLRVKSDLPDSASVVLTIAQNRFLLNSLNGEGFLNMRLAPEEIREVIGFDKQKQEFRECIQSNPCMMIRRGRHDFVCQHHNTYFKPALDAKVDSSALWPRIIDGLRLFDIDEDQLLGITAFRLSMVQRPRFTAELVSPNKTSNGTFGFLLGDAANAIHFWPGRGLNSGFAAAYSLAKTLAAKWNTNGLLRDSDFMRHEAAMAMLQYRHKTRAWRAMVRASPDGEVVPIQQAIGNSYRGVGAQNDCQAEFLRRLQNARNRLEGRLEDLPNDTELKKIASRVSTQTLSALVESDAWNVSAMAGEEADIDLLWRSAESKLETQSSPIAAPKEATAEAKPEVIKPTPRRSRKIFLWLFIVVVGLMFSGLRAPSDIERWLRSLLDWEMFR